MREKSKKADICRLLIAGSIGSIATTCYLFDAGEISLQVLPGKIAFLGGAGMFLFAVVAKSFVQCPPKKRVLAGDTGESAEVAQNQDNA